jgi:hypothetical protein
VPNDEDTLAHPEQPRFLLSSWLWAVALFVFFGAIVAITFGALQRGSTYEQERAANRAEKLKTARAEWNSKLNGYGWVDKSKGVAHIPIDRAMALEVSDLREKKPMAAGPIATPAPETVPGAAQPPNPTAAGAPNVSPTPNPVSIEGPNSEIRGQPASAANPPNVPANTQPGANATPAARPKSISNIAPVTPTNTPVQHSVGTPIPARGATGTSPAASPSPR